MVIFEMDSFHGTWQEALHFGAILKMFILLII